MDQSAQGMKTYNSVLQSARAKGEPIGVEHHLHDDHHKAWEEKNGKAPEDTVEKLEKLKFKKLKATPLAKQQAKQSPKKQEVSEEDAQARLLEKYRRLQKQKLADTLKCDDRLAHIKSVGNGL